MTIAGATTAKLVALGGYQAPFQPVNNPGGNAPVITGTVTMPSNIPTQTAGGVRPVGSGIAAYATTYFAKHMTSLPSYRYAYLFWMGMAAVAIIYGVCHHIRMSGGSLGAAFNKWGIRRVTIGPKAHRRSRALPSNSTLVMALLVAAAAVVLCLVGPDFVNPNVGMFDFTSVAATRVRKRWDLSNIPNYTISKSLWTMGNRFGFMSFAILPLVILLAAKSLPIAIFSWKWFTALGADKLMSFHRMAGWLVWGITTAHVALWTAQLFKDQYRGKAMWFSAFYAFRFVCGCVAYGLMTALMVTSQRPIRKHRYEFFYYSHVVLTLLMLVAAALHHPAIWWWIAAGGGIWAIDRLCRLINFARINSGGAKNIHDGKSYGDLATDDIVLEEFDDKMLPTGYDTPPGRNEALYDPYGGGYEGGYSGGGGGGGVGGYGSGEIQPLGTFDALHQQGKYDRSRRASGRSQMSRSSSVQSFATAPPAPQMRIPKPPVIPPGFAQAQLLPSRTVRLTIRTPRQIKWAAGQSIQLTLPELSKLQQHPFTIISSDPNELVILIKARKGLTRKLYNLVRGRADKSVAVSDKHGASIPRAAPVFVRAQVEGPYGSAGRIRWKSYSTILIICGGSGVSFGLAVVNHISKIIASGNPKIRRVRFVWVAREYAELAWAASALMRARAAVRESQLQVDIYVTNAEPLKQNARYDDFAPPRPGYAANQPQRSTSMDSLASEMSRDSAAYEPHQFDDMDEEMAAGGATLLDLTNYESEEDVEDPAEAELSRQVMKQGQIRRAKSRKAAKRAAAAEMQMRAPAAYPPTSSPMHSPAAYPPTSSPMLSPPARGTSLSPSPGMHGSPVMGSPGLPGSPSLGPRGLSPARHSQRASMGTFASTDMRSDDTHRGLLAPEVPDKRQSYRSIASSGYNYDRYDPYGGAGTGISPAPSMYFDDADSVRYAMSVRSRTQSMVLLEDTGREPLFDQKKRDAMSGAPSGLWIDEADYAAMSILSESARPGRPKLSQTIEEELQRADGAMLVATCGPEKLNTVVRGLVSRNIRPGKIIHGDKRGNVAIYCEDFEM